MKMMESQPGQAAPVVLLVEDNSDHAELIRRSLLDLNHGVQLRHVCDGEQALNYLFRRGRYIDTQAHPLPILILLDLRLPRVDGLEVLRQLKSDPRLQYIPVIVLSTSDADRDVCAAYEYHVNSYIAKPMGINGFQEMIDSVSRYWLNWNIKAVS